jgi:hypothetical protein
MSEIPEQLDPMARFETTLARARRLTLVAIGIAGVSLAASATLLVWQLASGKTLRAERIELVSPGGKVVATLRADDHETKLVLLGPQRQTRLELTASRVHSGIYLHGPGASPSLPLVTLQASAGGSNVDLSNGAPLETNRSKLSLHAFRKRLGASLDLWNRSGDTFKSVTLKSNAGEGTGLHIRSLSTTRSTKNAKSAKSTKDQHHASADLVLFAGGGQLRLSGASPRKRATGAQRRCSAELSTQRLMLWEDKRGTRTFSLDTTPSAPKKPASTDPAQPKK